MGYREKTDGNIYYKIVLQYILYGNQFKFTIEPY